MKKQYSGAALANRAAAAPETTMPRTPRLRHRPRSLAAAWRRAGLLLAALAWAATGAWADEVSDLRALITRGDLPAALARADQAVAAQPRDAQLQFLRGVVLMDLGRDAEALEAFTRLTQEHPDLPDPYNNIGLLQARAGQPEAALAALQEALRCDPSHRTARANLGQVHLMLAVKAWDLLARSGPLDLALRRKLEMARALLAPEPLPAAAPPAAR
jgi:Flp pilus assembly protein TadD